MKKRQVDLVLILVWPIIASFLSFLFKVNFLGATIFFLILPSIYLSLRDRKCVARAAIFSLVSMPFAFALEYLAVKNGAWYFPKSIFSMRIFDTIILEVLLWHFVWIYLVIIYYEYFLDKDAHTQLGSPRLKYPLFSFMAVFILILFSAIYTLPVRIPYFYLILGIVMVAIPIIVVLFEFPKLLAKFTKVTLYFSYLYLTMDVTEIALGHWYYPGQFIGWFELFGQRLPAEELIFWIILGAAAILSWYQYFDEKE